MILDPTDPSDSDDAGSSETDSNRHVNTDPRSRLDLTSITHIAMEGDSTMPKATLDPTEETTNTNGKTRGGKAAAEVEAKAEPAASKK